MRLDPAIAALRGDVAAQRRAQAPLEAVAAEWRVQAGAGLLDGLRRYSQGSPLKDCGALAEVFAGPDSVGLRALLSGWLACLAREPLGHIPARHQYAEGVGLLQLLECGGAALSFVLHEPTGPTQDPRTVSFVDAERHELVLAGAGYAVLHRWSGKDGEIAERREIPLRPGCRIELSGRLEAKQIVCVDRSLVILRLSRVAEPPRPSVELRLADGRIVHRATGDRGESCREIAMAVLTAMARRDALPALAARIAGGSSEERWQALRHCLALDSGEGVRHLHRIAGDPADPLCPHAAELGDALAARYPQFARFGREPCPA